MAGVQTTAANSFARVGTTISNRLDAALFTAIPTDNLDLLGGEFRKSWLQELRQLVDYCQQKLSLDLRWVENFAAETCAEKTWSPAVFSAIANLRMGVERSDITQIMDALARLRNLDRNTIYDAQMRIESILTEEWEWDFVPTMRAYEPVGKAGETTLVLPILGLDLAPYKSAIAEALKLVEFADPKIKAEFDALVTRIKLFQGRVLRGETNTRVYGAVFLRLPPQDWDQSVYWIEHLVHEIAHLRLELLRVHDPLVENDLTPRFRAPFRRDPRPMLGVLHATFVVARMMRVLSILQKRRPKAIYADRLRSLASKFEIGMTSLSDDGKFTPLGKVVVDSLREVAYDSAHS